MLKTNANRHIRQIAVCILALHVTYTAGAQPEYDRAARERARIQAENDARDKQNALNNAPVQSKWGQATGVFGRFGHYNEPSAEQLAKERAIKASSDQEWAATQDMAKRYQATLQLYDKYYQSFGVLDEYYETGRLAELTVSTRGNEVFLYDDIEPLLQLPAIYKTYAPMAATAPYETLFPMVSGFSLLYLKAVRALQALAVRFPEKKAETDIAIIHALQYKWGSTTRFNCRDCYYSRNKEMTDLFYSLAKTYPDSVRAITASEYNTNPYLEAIVAATAKGKKGEQELAAARQAYVEFIQRAEHK